MTLQKLEFGGQTPKLAFHNHKYCSTGFMVRGMQALRLSEVP